MIGREFGAPLFKQYSAAKPKFAGIIREAFLVEKVRRILSTMVYSALETECSADTLWNAQCSASEAGGMRRGAGDGTFGEHSGM